MLESFRFKLHSDGREGGANFPFDFIKGDILVNLGEFTFEGALPPFH